MNLKINNKNMEIFDILSFILLSNFIYNIFGDKSRLNKLSILINNKYWMGSFICVILLSVYVFFMNNKFNLYNKNNQKGAILATKRALIGFVTGICAYLDMTIFVFWFIWIISFYLEGWF